MYASRTAGSGSPMKRKKGGMMSGVRKLHCRYKSGLARSRGNPHGWGTTVILRLEASPEMEIWSLQS